jgi:hypothetical protein
VRGKKDFIFRVEDGAEKNTVQALLKTLQDAEPRATTRFLEAVTDAPVDSWGTDLSFAYRTEVSTSEPAGEPRYLIGISTNGRVVEDEPSNQDSRVDARIRVCDGAGLQATIFIEAKVGSNDLTDGQLQKYVEDFDITTEPSEDGQWTTAQWATVYRALQRETSEASAEIPAQTTVHEYLLTEYSEWLQQTGQVQHQVAEHETQEDGETHYKRLNAGINEADQYYIELYSETHAERNKSGAARIPQPVWRRWLDGIDQDVLEQTFGVPHNDDPDPDPNLDALREWAIREKGHSAAEFEDTGRRWVWEIEHEEEPEFPLKIKFVREDQLWVRTVPNVRYCPNFTPEEFEGVIGEVDADIRDAVFVDGDLAQLWAAESNS